MKLASEDKRIKYYKLFLDIENLEGIKEIPLPQGYHYVYYQKGDRDKWIEIEQSTGEVESYEDAIKAWNKYFADYEDILGERMMFIEDEKNEKIGTLSAYFDPTGKDPITVGRPHWLSIKPEYQGKGLSKPFMTRCLVRLRELGYSYSKISTQTWSWVGCKVYLDLGFKPTKENLKDSYEGWRIVKTITNHPTLKELESLEYEEIFTKEEKLL